MAKIVWYGHSALKVEIAGKTLIVDPMLDQNPNSPIKAAEVTQADAVYVTHDHPDHLGEAFDICKRTNATFVAVYELAEQAAQQGVQNVAHLNVGGTWQMGGASLTVVQAVHSASKGTPTGVIIQGEDTTIYHSGDTALFGDMKLIGDHYRISLACLPMGGTFTMDAEHAAEAVMMLRPQAVLPMHYATFPVLAKNTSEFVEKVKSLTKGVEVLSLKPGELYDVTAGEAQVSPQS